MPEPAPLCLPPELRFLIFASQRLACLQLSLQDQQEALVLNVPPEQRDELPPGTPIL